MSPSSHQASPISRCQTPSFYLAWMPRSGLHGLLKGFQGGPTALPPCLANCGRGLCDDDLERFRGMPGMKFLVQFGQQGQEGLRHAARLSALRYHPSRSVLNLEGRLHPSSLL